MSAAPTQTEAQRLADWLDAHANGPMAVQLKAAALLRRQQEIIELAREAGFGIGQGISAIRINGYVDDLLRLAERFGAGGGEPVNQWRKVGTGQWWDGFPDHSDGGGPYETRTLYANPSPTDLRAEYLRGLEDAAKVADDDAHVVDGRGYYDQLGDAKLTAANIRNAIEALKGKQ